MIKIGLIGSPIAHSLSPQIHHGFIKSAGMSGCYELFEMDQLPPEGLRAFMVDKGLTGLNITIPFKESVLKELDEVDASAKELGAINTVVFENQKLVGYNTDVYGIAVSIDELNIAPCKTLVFGSGGASKAVVNVLEDRGFTPIVVSRTSASTTYDNLSSQEVAECRFWVNCTPVGTEGITPNLLPLPFAVLNEEFAIFDLVYKPNPTPLMTEALQRGAKVIGGEKMLTEQARKSWQLFHDAYYKNL